MILMCLHVFQVQISIFLICLNYLSYVSNVLGITYHSKLLLLEPSPECSRHLAPRDCQALVLRFLKNFCSRVCHQAGALDWVVCRAVRCESPAFVTRASLVHRRRRR